MFSDKEMYLPPAVSPTPEFEIAFLIIKRKPCNVYLARALKDAWRDIEAAPVMGDHHVRLEGSVELLVRAGVRQQQQVKQQQQQQRQRRVVVGLRWKKVFHVRKVREIWRGAHR